MLLKNKTICMTGGASGIGRATVQALAAEGARVLLCDINEAGAAETIKLSKGGPVEFVKVDLSNLASAEACGKEVLQRTGNKVDIQRDFGNQHSKLTVNYDGRISSGDLKMPGLPGSGEGGDGAWTFQAMRRIARP